MDCDVFFSHSTNLENKVKEYILKANFRVLICCYGLSISKFTDAIDSAIERGIEVKIITDVYSTKYNSQLDLDKYDVKVISMSNTKLLMHNKFCIIDDTIVITGSYNFSNKGNYNYENLVIIDDYNVGLKFISEFNKIDSDNTDFLEKQKVAIDSGSVKLTLVIKGSQAYLMKYSDLEDWYYNGNSKVPKTLIEDSSIYFSIEDDMDADGYEYVKYVIKQKAIDALKNFISGWINGTSYNFNLDDYSIVKDIFNGVNGDPISDSKNQNYYNIYKSDYSHQNLRYCDETISNLIAFFNV